MSAVHSEAIQKQIQQDWANREYIEVITASIKKITDFLNSFDMSCRGRLAGLNEKLTTLERRIEYLEARKNLSRRDLIEVLNGKDWNKQYRFVREAWAYRRSLIAEFNYN